jgi:hypothetical protein
MKRLIFLFAMMTSAAYGQANIAGLLFASNFANWSLPPGNQGPSSWSAGQTCTVTSGGVNFTAFTVGVPVEIFDTGNPENSEIVTPYAVTVNNAGCTVGIAPTRQHKSFVYRTATAGLGEAIGYAGKQYNQIILTPAWQVLGGQTSMITSSIGNANVTILDQRSSVLVSYMWNGSQYIASGTGGSVDSVFGRTGAVIANSGDYSVGQVTGAAPLASPALTGTPTAPTQAISTNNTDIATTAAVNAALNALNPSNLAGGALGSAPYQSAPNTTVFISSPTNNGHTFVFAWQPSGSAVAPTALDFTAYMASPPPIGTTNPDSGLFTNIGVQILNGESECAAYPGSTVDAKANACLADAMNLTNGNTSGIANAAGLGGSRFNTVSQITVGNSSGVGVGFILPCSGVWAGTMTGGTQDVIKYYDGASIYSLCPASGLAAQFGITAASGSSLLHVFETATSSNPYMVLQGFNVINIAGGAATASGVTFALNGPTNDGSFASAVNVYASLDATCVRAYNVSSATTWMHSSINCGNFGTPFVAATDASGYVQSLVLEDMTLVHAGTGLPEFQCTDTRAVTPHISYVAIHHSYTETGTDGVTPSIQIAGCNKVDITDHIFKSQSSGRSPSPAEITTTNAYNTDLEVNGAVFSQGSGTYTYPVPVVSNGFTGEIAYSDSLGHFTHYSPPSSPSYFGTTTFSGPIFSKVVNGISYSNLYSGSTLDVRANACISDAETLANGNTTGICDSTGETGAESILATIVVGSLANAPVTWRLPINATWTASGFTGGTACAIQQYSQTKIVGEEVPISDMVITNTSAANGLSALYCNTPGTNGSAYFRASGFYLRDNTVALNSGYVMLVSSGFDGTYYGHIQVTNYAAGQGGILVGGNGAGSVPCCTMSFDHITVGGNFTGGVQMEVLGSTSNGSPNSILCLSCSLTHPASGTNNFVCLDANAHTASVTFVDLYEEGAQTSNTTAYNSINGCARILVSGGGVESIFANATNTIWNVTSNSHLTSLLVDGQQLVKNFTLPNTAAITEQYCNGVVSPCTIPSNAQGLLTSYRSLMNYFDQTYTFGMSSTPWPTVASAATIAPTSTTYSISGTNAIGTITLPPNFTTGCTTVLALAAFTTTTGGNMFNTAFTASANTLYQICYNGTSWYIK